MASHIWTCRQMSLLSRAVGPQTSREGIRDLYDQVYKLRRLPGSPLCGLEWTEELIGDVVSSLKNHLRQKGGHPPRGLEESKLADAWPSWSKTPRGRRRDASAERDLAETREAHQRALASMAALEKKIERLSRSITRGQLDACTHLQSCDHQRRRSQEQNRRHHRALPEDSPVHSPEHSPPWWGKGAWENKGAELPFLEFNLGPPPVLGPDVDCFLQELASGAREDSGSNSSPEPPVEEYRRWVTWWGQALGMPGWWQELVAIPEVDNYQELTWKIQASFKLAQWMNKLHDVGNCYLAPLVPPCLYQNDFLLPSNPKFPCWDIREEQLEKTVAYAQALQFWVEKSNPPTPGQPCLLARSILELREVMGPYVSFLDDAILSGVAPTRRIPGGPARDGHFWEHPASICQPPIEEATAEKAAPIEDASTQEAAPIEDAAAEEAAPIWSSQEELINSQTPSEALTKKVGSPIQFPWWREVLHPSRPVTTTGQAPLIPHESRQRACSQSSGEGGLNAKGQRSICGWKVRSQSPHCQLGH